MHDLLCTQPVAMRFPPRLLARIVQSEPQQQRRDLLALALQIIDRRLARPGQIAHRLVVLVGHPHRRQLAGPEQPGQVLGIAPVGLDAVAGLRRNERWRHHDAVVTEALDQAVEPIPRRPGLVAERQLVVARGELGDELAGGRLGGVELALEAHFAAASAVGNGHRILQLRGIDSDESFAILSYDLPSLCEALPGQSGQPSISTSRVSRLLRGRDIQSGLGDASRGRNPTISSGLGTLGYAPKWR